MIELYLMESQQQIAPKIGEPLLKPKSSSPSEAVAPNVPDAPQEPSRTNPEIHAIRLGLNRASKESATKNENGQPRSPGNKPDGFEPFVNPQTSESPYKK